MPTRGFGGEDLSIRRNFHCNAYRALKLRPSGQSWVSGNHKVSNANRLLGLQSRRDK